MRARVITAAAAALLAIPFPASAYNEYSGFEPTEGLSVLQTIAWFVAGPAAVFGAVWFLWSLPKWLRSGKTKEVQPWNG